MKIDGKISNPSVNSIHLFHWKVRREKKTAVIRLQWSVQSKRKGTHFYGFTRKGLTEPSKLVNLERNCLYTSTMCHASNLKTTRIGSRPPWPRQKRAGGADCVAREEGQRKNRQVIISNMKQHHGHKGSSGQWREEVTIMRLFTSPETIWNFWNFEMWWSLTLVDAP